MGKTVAPSSTESLTDFIDIIYMSDKPALPAEIKRLFRQKKLSSRLLPLEGYRVVHLRPDLVGTVIIDAEGMDTTQDHRLGRVLESLERDNLGIILLTQRVQRPVKSFSLIPSDSSFSMDSKFESISLDALWARISVNLADRKKQNSGITVKPAALRSAIEKRHAAPSADQVETGDALMDNLTEQLRLAGLVQRDFLPSHLPNCAEAQFVGIIHFCYSAACK